MNSERYIESKSKGSMLYALEIWKQLGRLFIRWQPGFLG